MSYLGNILQLNLNYVNGESMGKHLKRHFHIQYVTGCETIKCQNIGVGLNDRRI